jgi:PAS domain S-box-containing protein
VEKPPTLAIADSMALRLAAVIDSADDAIISQGVDGTIEIWNRAAERMYGYSGDEAIGSSIDIIVPPDRRIEEKEVIARLFAGEEVRAFETIRVAKDGTVIPISLMLSTVVGPDGQIIGVSRIARDLTDQKRLEGEAFRLAAIVDSSEDAIASKDLNGVVRTWNHAAERMFGFSAAEIIGRHISLIIPADRLSEEDEVLSRVRSGRSMEHFETIRQRKDGSLIEISLTVSPIRGAGGVIIGASKIARDITIQRQMIRQAEEANRAKDEFLAMLSHELRTPLNAVMGYMRMLRLGHFGEGGQERVVEIIERNAQLLSQLVSDVLDVSTIVTGKVRLKLAECDISNAVEASLDIVRPTAESKGVILTADIPPDPVMARCDPDRIQQVFWNLLSNAVKFTPRGGRVAVRLARSTYAATFTVADTGIGIRRESLPYVFQRFWQEGTASGRQGGMGLGLALARHFVELHGGTITVVSPGEGEGATFEVSLPVIVQSSSGSN